MHDTCWISKQSANTYPNTLQVEEAFTFKNILKSVWSTPIVATKKAVIVPKVVTTVNMQGDSSNIEPDLTIRKTPAITIVATRIKVGLA